MKSRPSKRGSRVRRACSQARRFDEFVEDMVGMGDILAAGELSDSPFSAVDTVRCET
jgi:hypothetical protein